MSYRYQWNDSELTLDIDAQDRILWGRFKGPSQILDSSITPWLEWLKEKNINFFLDVNSDALSTYEFEVHPVIFQMTVYLIRDYLGLDEVLAIKARNANIEKKSPMQCFCYGIDQTYFGRLKEQAISVSQLKQNSKAATGCGSCSGLVEEIVNLQYLKTMGDNEEQLSILTSIIYAEKMEKYVCKCFKLTLLDLWKTIQNFITNQYPLMGVNCHSCLHEVPSGAQSKVSVNEATPFFYFQGKSFIEWGKVFQDWIMQNKFLFLQVAGVKTRELTLSKLSTGDETINDEVLKQFKQDFGQDWIMKII